MKSWKKDEIVEEVRKIRERVAKREAADPEEFHRHARELAKKLGIRRSKLKPIKIDFSRLSKKAK